MDALQNGYNTKKSEAERNRQERGREKDNEREKLRAKKSMGCYVVHYVAQQPKGEKNVGKRYMN